VDLCAASAVDLARMIRARELSAVELLEAVLARIEAVNSSVNASWRSPPRSRTYSAP
jgi:amidase